jgi:polyisoprenoid-binding protein YceI
MRTTIKSVLTALAVSTVFASSAAAQMALPRNLSLGKESKLWVEGTSTVKSWSCAAGKLDVDVVAEPDAAAPEIVRSASLVAPVASLDCKNNTMNEHMRKALKADKNANISWKLTSYRVEGANVIITGKLQIAGKENPIELRGTGTAVNGTIKVKGSKQFNMSEFGVKPPSLMMGTMKVRDLITVSYDLVLNP